MIGLEAALFCIALNVFYEARGEPTKGQFAVAYVTLNRARLSNNDVCTVVFAPAQFSWTKLYQGAIPRGDAWHKAELIALRAYKSKDRMGDITHFHNLTVQPKWTANLRHVVQIGNHHFYREI